MSSTLRQPTALIPLVMSCAALAVIAAHIAVSGITRQADEGAAAHLWQLLMAGQIPVIGLFALMWLPRAPRQALLVLSLQAVALIAAAAPIFLLNW